MLQRLVDLLGQHSLEFGFGAVFGVLLLCGFGLPMPEDVVLVTGGVLAWLASPRLPGSVATVLHDPGYLQMAAVGLAGILAGDSIIYLVGRRIGDRATRIWPLRRMFTPEKIERVGELMRARGSYVVIIARYLPGLRAPTFFTAGHARFPYWRFVLLDGLAASISAPVWVGVGFYFGDDIHEAAHVASELGNYILAGGLTVAAIFGLRAWWRHRRRMALKTPTPSPGPVTDGAPKLPQAGDLPP